MRRRLLSVWLLGLLGLVVVLSGAVPASSAAAPPAWGPAIEVPGTATLNYGGYALVNSVSCTTAGNCTGGGSYYDSFGGQQAFVADETNGTWGTAIEVPGTATLNAAGTASVTAVSCSTPGNCTAGGTYTDAQSEVQAFIVDETSGTWGTAIEVPGTSTLNAGNATVASISCASDGNCTVGGLFHDSSHRPHTYVIDKTSGTWGTAIEVPGIGALNTGSFAQVTSVSCATAGNCDAGGIYDDASGHQQVFVAEETSGTWGTAIELPGTATLNSGGSATVRSVSCPAAGNCTAVGSYIDGSGHQQVFVADETIGTWGAAIEAPGTATLNSGGSARAVSVSCSSVGNCAAGGFYFDGSGFQRAFLVAEINGTWGTAIEVPGTATANSEASARVNQVSCAADGSCVAGGWYVDDEDNDSDGDYSAFVINETNGGWGTAIAVPGTVALDGGEDAQVTSLSCATANNCAVGGWYVDINGETQALVADSVPDTASHATPAPASGTFGGTTTLSATLVYDGDAVPNENVSFSLNGTSVGSAMTDGNGVATLQNVSLSGIDPGSYPAGVAASFAGDGSIPASSGSNSLTISPIAQAIGISMHAPTDATYGDQFSVAATGGASGNPVTYGSSGSCSNTGANYTMTGSGQCTVTYDQAGSTDYSAAPELTETVNGHKANQAIQITTDAPASAGYGTSFTVAATGGGSGNGIAYGSSGACTNAGAEFTMTSSVGTCTVTYDQAGNTNYNAATQETESVTAQKADQTITFAALATHTYGNPDFDAGATASSGDQVSYVAVGNCGIVAGFVDITGAGSCTVTASQAGDADYKAAPLVQRTFSIRKAALSITATNQQKYYSQPLTLKTTSFVTSGLFRSDSITGVTLTSAGAAASAASGTYAIVPSNAVAGPSTNLAANYTITFHNGALHVIAVGIIGLNGVSVAATGGKIDSFDSTRGVYGSANHTKVALVLSNGPLSFSGASLYGSAISTQGSVSVASGAGVSGSVIAGTTASIAGIVVGTVTQHAPSRALSLPTVAACSPLSPTTGISGGSFTYFSGNLVVNSGTVRLASRTYCFNTVTLAAGSTLSVSGPVTINLRGKLTGAGQIVNTTTLPANLRIKSSYSGSGGVAIVGGYHAAMTILAPKTDATITGGAFFGTLLAGAVNLTGGIVFHADQALEG